MGNAKINIRNIYKTEHKLWVWLTGALRTFVNKSI